VGRFHKTRSKSAETLNVKVGINPCTHSGFLFIILIISRFKCSNTNIICYKATSHVKVFGDKHITRNTAHFDVYRPLISVTITVQCGSWYCKHMYMVHTALWAMTRSPLLFEAVPCERTLISALRGSSHSFYLLACFGQASSKFRRKRI